MELSLIAAQHYPELRHRLVALGIENIVDTDGAMRDGLRDLSAYDDIKPLEGATGNHDISLVKNKIKQKECFFVCIFYY